MREKLVYSTENGDLRRGKAKKEAQSKMLPSGIKNDGIIRIQKESKGRGGKFVTCIYGIPYAANELSLFVKKIKQKLATGGNVKDGVVMIQGDKVRKIKELLEYNGLKVKIVGSK
jgi:translation initiation factor 1